MCNIVRIGLKTLTSPPVLMVEDARRAEMCNIVRIGLKTLTSPPVLMVEDARRAGKMLDERYVSGVNTLMSTALAEQ
jgi:hypothetical protein